MKGAQWFLICAVILVASLGVVGSASSGEVKVEEQIAEPAKAGIVLSLFIGVRSIWLDYIFTISIALLAYVVYLVVDDLDNPLRPGLWQMTPHEYQELLRRLEATPQTVEVS